MTLAEGFASRIVAKTPPKILTLDIERMKGQALVEFWDLGDFKNRRLHPSDVTLWPRTICLAWRWYGGKRVEFAAEWEDGGHEAMLRKAWDLYHQADIVVGHNLQGKTDRYDVEVARRACAGDKAAQRKLKAYNVGDIVATEALYDDVRGWIPNHPHIGLWSGDEDGCGNCGGELKASDWCRTAVTAYAQYVCTNCGAWYRRNDIKMRTRTRPAR